MAFIINNFIVLIKSQQRAGSGNLDNKLVFLSVHSIQNKIEIINLFSFLRVKKYESRVAIPLIHTFCILQDIVVCQLTSFKFNQ